MTNLFIAYFIGVVLFPILLLICETFYLWLLYRNWFNVRTISDLWDNHWKSEFETLYSTAFAICIAALVWPFALIVYIAVVLRRGLAPLWNKLINARFI